MDLQAREYADSYVNGNRQSTCLEILTGPNPTVMAAKVTLLLAREATKHHKSYVADEFIRILARIVQAE